MGSFRNTPQSADWGGGRVYCFQKSQIIAVIIGNVTTVHSYKENLYLIIKMELREARKHGVLRRGNAKQVVEPNQRKKIELD